MGVKDEKIHGIELEDETNQKDLSHEEIEEKIWNEYYPNLKLDARHDLFETKELTGRSEKVGRIRKPVMNVTLSGCPECGYPIKGYDAGKGETVCPKCGAVLNYDIIPDENQELQSEDKDLPWNRGITVDEQVLINNIKRNRQKKFQTKEEYTKARPKNKKDWRKSRHYMTVDSIASMLMMTKQQKQLCRDIIDEYSLHELHTRANSEVVVAGICRYVLEKNGRGKELRYNRDAFILNGLDRFKYKIIKGNLDRLNVLS